MARPPGLVYHTKHNNYSQTEIEIVGAAVFAYQNVIFKINFKILIVIMNVMSLWSKYLMRLSHVTGSDQKLSKHSGYYAKRLL